MLAEWAAKISVQPSTIVAILTILLARLAPAGARQYVVAAGVGMLAPEAVARVGQLGSGTPATAAELRRRADAYKAQIQARRQNTLTGSAAPSSSIPMAPSRRRADIAA